MPYGPEEIVSVMVEVQVPAWAFPGMTSPHVFGRSMAPIPVLGAALTTAVGVQVVPEPVVALHPITGIVEAAESVGGVHVECRAMAPHRLTVQAP